MKKASAHTAGVWPVQKALVAHVVRDDAHEVVKHTGAFADHADLREVGEIRVGAVQKRVASRMCIHHFTRDAWVHVDNRFHGKAFFKLLEMISHHSVAVCA